MLKKATPGVHEIFGLIPSSAVIRLRLLLGEVVIEIENGFTKTSNAAYLSPTEARRLAAEYISPRIGHAHYNYGRDDDGVYIAGAMIVILGDGEPKDKVVIESNPKAERFCRILAMLADDAERGKTIN